MKYIYPQKPDAISFRECVVNSDLTRGSGIEWGALYWPTPHDEHHSVTYCDFKSKQDSISCYKDMAPAQNISPGFVEPEHVLEFKKIPQTFNNLDFFIANHVLEHYDNLLEFLTCLSAILRPGGRAMISVPDSDKTHDKLRPDSTMCDVYLSSNFTRRWRQSKIIEHIILAEQVDYASVMSRFSEIMETRLDPHVWVFRHTTFEPIMNEILEKYNELKLKVTRSYYNRYFYEMILILERTP